MLPEDRRAQNPLARQTALANRSLLKVHLRATRNGGQPSVLTTSSGFDTARHLDPILDPSRTQRSTPNVREQVNRNQTLIRTTAPRSTAVNNWYEDRSGPSRTRTCDLLVRSLMQVVYLVNSSCV